MPTYVQADRPLAITTPLGPDELLLTGVDGREGISELFHFRLQVLAENTTDVAFDKLLGQKVAAKIRVDARASRYVAGYVNRIAQGARDEIFTEYWIDVVPQFWMLSRKTQSRIFQAV